jgi:hypothetical protein
MDTINPITTSRQLNQRDLFFELKRGDHFGSKARVKDIMKVIRLTPVISIVTTHRNRCVQVNEFTGTVHKGKWVYRQVIKSSWYTKKSWPKPVERHRLGLMLLGSDKTPDLVIDRGIVHHNIGISWIEIRTATEQDYYTIPTVEGQ